MFCGRRDLTNSTRRLVPANSRWHFFFFFLFLFSVQFWISVRIWSFFFVLFWLCVCVYNFCFLRFHLVCVSCVWNGEPGRHTHTHTHTHTPNYLPIATGIWPRRIMCENVCATVLDLSVLRMCRCLRKGWKTPLPRSWNREKPGGAGGGKGVVRRLVMLVKGPSQIQQAKPNISLDLSLSTHICMYI